MPWLEKKMTILIVQSKTLKTGTSTTKVKNPKITTKSQNQKNRQSDMKKVDQK